MAKPPRVYTSPAIVLRQRKLGDADKILTLYTAEFGKVDAVAKGVRRMTSRLAGHVEPLNHGSFMLAHGRSLDIVTQVQTIETFQPIRSDLDRLGHALYAAELLERATEERAQNFALYRLLLDTLRRLSQRDDLGLVLRYFEMALLDELGYRPQLDACVFCGGALAVADSAWVAGAGGVICDREDCRRRCYEEDLAVRPLSPNALRVLRLFQQETFQTVASIGVDAELASELERGLRDAVHHALEREVRAARFLDAVRRRRIPKTGAAPQQPV